MRMTTVEKRARPNKAKKAREKDAAERRRARKPWHDGHKRVERARSITRRKRKTRDRRAPAKPSVADYRRKIEGGFSLAAFGRKLADMFGRRAAK